MSWRLVSYKTCEKGREKISQSGLKPQANRLLDLLREDPHTEIRHPMKNSWATCRMLILEGSNIQHRLIYQILTDIAHGEKLSACGRIMNNPDADVFSSQPSNPAQSLSSPLIFFMRSWLLPF
ncbi:MAG: hypothetical protein MZV70_23445 [Desulfobacterales bacterium]|nr:hypothetical protein [Desulfobacterales bacterium]